MKVNKYQVKTEKTENAAKTNLLWGRIIGLGLTLGTYIYLGVWSYPREVEYMRWREEVVGLQMKYYPQFAVQRDWDRKQNAKFCYVAGPLCVFHLWVVDGYDKIKVPPGTRIDARLEKQ